MNNALVHAMEEYTIPNFGAKWDQVVLFALRPFYFLGKNTR